MTGGLVGSIIGSATADTETSPVGSVMLLLFLGAIGFGIYKLKRFGRAKGVERQAEQARVRGAEVADLLAAEHDAPRSLTGVTVPLPYRDKNGNQREQWSPRLLAMTARHLIVFDMSGPGRTTLRLADVATTSTAHGQLTVTLSNGGAYRFGVTPEALASVERDIRDLAATSRGSASHSVADELAKLDELRRQGVIDADDWERAKELFLGKSEDAQQRAARELRQIHELHRSGVLSASEFNMKKWDILARTS